HRAGWSSLGCSSCVVAVRHRMWLGGPASVRRLGSTRHGPKSRRLCSSLTGQRLRRIPPLMAIGRLKGVEDTAEMPAKENVQRLRQQLDSYMAQQGLRSTGQRRVIVDQFFRSKGHITIDDLLEQVRIEDSGIGYATVYRTMKMLA